MSAVVRRLAPLVTLVFALACRGDAVHARADVGDPVRALPQATVEKLARKRIYFGHQSVGRNIVEALEAALRERPGTGLRVVESRSKEAFVAPGFFHARNGENGEPVTKIRDFADAIDAGGLGAKLDVALFKFCYVDFVPGTDVETIFAEYRSALARLRARFPTVTFVHVTVPLAVVDDGPKATLKRWLGRSGEAEANVVRERFNELMRAEYRGREPLFDLAAVEATRPDGQPVRFEQGGRRYRALASEYASDGRHLNAAGGRWAAAHLLETLAAAVD